MTIPCSLVVAHFRYFEDFFGFLVQISLLPLRAVDPYPAGRLHRFFPISSFTQFSSLPFLEAQRGSLASNLAFFPRMDDRLTR